jgi:hypothetical protein
MKRSADIGLSPRSRRALAIMALFGCLAVAAPLSPSEQPSRPLSFGVMGDLPYTAAEISLFPDFIREMNQDRDLEFVLHLGDFKDGGFSRCTDEIFLRARAWFDLSAHPLVYTPGDNEWTDCHRAGLGAYDPLERLDRLRRIFFEGERSLGQKAIILTRQSRETGHAEFRENARWILEEVVFATLHVVGSNDNLNRSAAEHAKRNAAALSWMREAFGLARAQAMRAVVLIAHANPFFEKKPDQRTGFNPLVAELEAQAREFDGPVLFIHGDTHSFRVDRPLSGVSGLTRLETFGSPRMDWVKVTIGPGASPRFRIEPGRFGKEIAPAGFGRP